ncbi:MAG: VWA domain-containing protein [candidate division Zixibacteria bacterium]|nr:VWA domain-containing protein [candidate division Zixibacteria bacterium]
MKKLLMYLVIVFPLMLTISAFADPNDINQPDDPYYGGITLGERNNYPDYLPSTYCTPTDTVIISQLDCGAFPYICAYVDVLDSLGNPISGLVADSFCVFQDDSPIAPGSFTVEEMNLDSCISSVCLVIDVSGSMGSSKMNAAKAAANTFVDEMDIYDRVAIVTFGNCFNVVQDFTSDKTLLHSKINSITSGGWTAVFDGIWKGVELTTTELGSKAVIAISDGMENYSQLCGGSETPDGLWIGPPPYWWWQHGTPDPDGWEDDSTIICDLANTSGIPVYTISLGSSFDPQYLIHISAATGGSYYHAPTGDDIEFIYEDIKYRMCSRYYICYDSPDTIQNGDWHTMTVCRMDEFGACNHCDSSSCQESATPEIVRTPETVNLDNTCQQWGTDVEICAYVTDLDTPQEDLDVKLFYRNSYIASFTSVNMTRTDSVYCCDVPASELECGTDSIQYYVTASDGQVAVSSPPSAGPGAHHAFPVCVNHPPVAHCPWGAKCDTTYFVCDLSEICIPGFYCTDPDDNLASCEAIGGTLSGDSVCITPVVGLNYIKFIATDDCGLADTCIIDVRVILNRPPQASCPDDTSLFMCDLDEICLTGFNASDPDNNIVSQIVSIGTLNCNTVCFTPTVGLNTITFTVIDACGDSAECSTDVTVSLNSPPQVSCPNDTSLFVCDLSEICLPGFTVSDNDDNINSIDVSLGTYDNGTVCFTPAAGLNTITLTAVDECGDSVVCETDVNITLNSPPSANCTWGGSKPGVGDTTVFVCNLNDICLSGFSCTDPDDNLASCTAIGGTLDGNSICFTPSEGINTIKLVALDECGEADTLTRTVNVGLNSAPSAACPGDTSLFVCDLNELCLPGFNVSDNDDNISSVNVSLGVLDNGTVCFTPAEGLNTIALTVTDECGETDQCTTDVAVALNSAPVVSCPNDTSLFVCDDSEICLPGFSYSDTDNNIASATAVGGTLNGNSICFTPASGNNTLKLIVADECGEIDSCQTNVNITFNTAPVCDIPNDTTFLVFGDTTFSFPVSATDADGNLDGCAKTSGVGSFDGSDWTFTTSGQGVYSATFECTDDCGASCSGTLNITVNYNSAPVCNLPDDSTYFVCDDTTFSFIVSATDDDENLVGCTKTSGPGTLVDTVWTFTTTGPGVYTAEFECEDIGGATCYGMVNITVNYNSAPVCIVPDDETYLVCGDSAFSFSISASDVDNNLDGCAKTSGDGSFDGSTWSFTSTGAGIYSAVFECEDECGETCSETVSITVDYNSAPAASCPNDTSIFVCTLDQICLAGFTASDADDNITSKVVDNGTLTTGTVCFTPAAGLNTITYTVTDACGETDQCVTNVTVTLNSPPAASCPNDTSIFACDLSDICLPGFSSSDADGNITSEVVDNGTLNAGTVCFTPTAGLNAITYTVTDACGDYDDCTVNVTVTVNSPPEASCPWDARPGFADTTIFVCVLDEICISGFSCSDPDGNLASCSAIGGTLVGNSICFTPVEGNNTIKLVAIDDCGEADTCDAVIGIVLNSPPSASCPNDTSLFVCDLSDICLSGFSASDPDDNILSTEVDLGVLDNGTVCFTPVAGLNTITYTVTDSCNETDECTVNVTAVLNSPPSASCPNDTSMFVCDLNEICLPGFTASDADDNITSIVVDNGTLTGNSVCFDPTAGLNTINYIVTDACGESDTCTTNISITLNSPPSANCTWGGGRPGAGDTLLFVCELDEICLGGFSCTDPDNNLLSCEAIGGTLSGDAICFTPVEGINVIELVALDECGEADTLSRTVNVTLNSPPIAACPDDTTMLVCDLSEICLSGFVSSDVDDNIISKSVSFGTLNGTSACFIPTEGLNTIMFIVTDECGEADTCSTDITVNVNNPPTAECPGDSTIFVCNIHDIYLPGFTCSDPDGNLDNCEVIGGTLSGNIVHFTPVEGLNTIKLVAADECGETDTCETNVTVIQNSAPVAACPNDTTLAVCSLSSICIPGFSDSDADNNITSRTVSLGTLDAGTVCFTPAAGLNTITYTVTDACGETDQCVTNVTVTLNSPPAASCPNDTSIFACDLSDICLPGFSSSDADGNITSEVVDNGTLNAGTVCFTPTAGLNAITYTVTDACGDYDDCTVNVTVTVNSPPEASCPWDARPGFADTTIFVCVLDEICISGFSCSDPDGNLASCSAIGGTLVGNSICFTPVEGNNTIKLVAIDDCGEADTCDAVIGIVLNSPPSASCPNDTSLFVCDLSDICLSGFSASDPDDNILSTEVDLGVLDNGTVCFTPVAGLNTITYTVTDSCNETDECTVNVTAVLNSPPSASCPNDTSMFVCDLNEICLPGFTASDADDNITSIVVDNGTLTGNSVCFTPSIGLNTITYTVTDACSEVDQCATNITISLNSDPVCNLPSDESHHIYGDSTFSYPVSATDVDDNLVGCSMISGAGSFDGSTWTFTATSSGIYSAAFECTDECGAACSGTVNITITMNNAPECHLPDDAYFFICNDSTFSFPVYATDDDSDLVGCTLTGGMGSYDGTNWTFTTSGSGIYWASFECEDAGGESCIGTVNMTIDLNDAPVCQVPDDASYLVCDDTTFSIPITAVDDDDNLSGCIKVLGDGNFDGSSWTFNTTGQGAFSAIFECEDECGETCADSITIIINYNTPPVCDIPDNQSFFVCDDTTFGFAISATDIDNNLVGCSKTSGPGSFDGSTWTFTTDSEGVYTGIFECEDACGETCIDTLEITVDYNSPPECSMPDDNSYFICFDSTFSFPVSAADEDDNLVGCSMLPGGDGNFDGSNWTFTTSGSGVYSAVFECEDECGAVCAANKSRSTTVNITVTVNSAPEVTCVDDTTIAVCDLSELCISGFNYNDVDNNINNVNVNTGTIVGSTVCFTPVEGLNTLILTVIDDCGLAAVCTTDVTINLNTPPLVNCPPDDQIRLGSIDTVCLSEFYVHDYEDNLDTAFSNIGIFYPNEEMVCFLPDTGINTIILTAIDDCGEVSVCTTLIDIEIENCPEFLNDSLTVMCIYENFCDTLEAIDVDGDYIVVTANYGEITTLVDEPGYWLGVYCFTVPDSACGEHMEFDVVITACDGICDDNIGYNLTILGYIDYYIDEDVMIAPGLSGTVGIYLNTYDCVCIGGLTMVIHWDPSVLVLQNALITENLDFGNEYNHFTYDIFGPGTIKFSYIADLNDQVYHGPLCDIDPNEPILNLQFLLVPQEYPDDISIPICFFHEESINDNAVADSTGYHVWYGDGCSDAPDSSQFGTFLLNLYCGSVRVLDDCNPIIGDINMNRYPFELGDAMTMANHLIDPIGYPFTENQMWASDVNQDGYRATVADLIFMINVVNGSNSNPKLVPVETRPVELIIEQNENDETIIKFNSEFNIGGLLLELPISEDIDCNLQLNNDLDMEVELKQYDESMRLCVYDLESKVIQSGTTELMRMMLPKGVKLTPSLMSFSDGNGCLINTLLKREVPLPEQFSIVCCYPNPFNPTTTIEFALPVADNVTLNIYDISGRLVKELASGQLKAGYHYISWNGINDAGKNTASGIYFAKLKSNNEIQNVSIKKLVLLK